MAWIIGADWLILATGFGVAVVAGWPVVSAILIFCRVGGKSSRASIAIGIIERGLVFAFAVAGEFIAVTVLIGIKSIVPILDNSIADRDRVVLGTLCSIAWALICLLATIAAMSWI
jgi:hypothetical protein